MSKLVFSFMAVMGCVLSSERYTYKGESWKRELDLADYEKMDLKQTWDDWVKYFHRTYISTEEEKYRFSVFQKNVEKIAEWNTDKSHKSKVRPNMFADMTKDEFTAYIKPKSKPKPQIALGKKQHRIPVKEGSNPTTTSTDPVSIDWSELGYVSPVDYLGEGPGCWAYSVSKAIECNYAIAHGTLTQLSGQQLIDCAGLNANCNKRHLNDAYAYVIKNGGLCSSDSYPYTAGISQCQDNTCTAVDPIRNYTDVTPQDETALQHAVAQGCVSVGVQANQFAFEYYSSGILNDTCGTDIDHDLLLVGYGTQDGQQYWKAQNYWGDGWGEDGYILICKDCQKNGDQGECGINDIPSYPVV